MFKFSSKVIQSNEWFLYMNELGSFLDSYWFMWLVRWGRKQLQFLYPNLNIVNTSIKDWLSWFNPVMGWGGGHLVWSCTDCVWWCCGCWRQSLPRELFGVWVGTGRRKRRKKREMRWLLWCLRESRSDWLSVAVVHSSQLSTHSA